VVAHTLTQVPQARDPGGSYLAGYPFQYHVVGDADPQGVHFAAEDSAFVPDARDLLELLDNQVTAHGSDPAQKSLTITYTPAHHWGIEITDGNWAVVVSGHETIHAVLPAAFFLAVTPR
jgi:hypothetical protein